jgi:hypothetical protein
LDFKVQRQGIELAEQAADVAPGGVGIGHDPQAIRPAAQGRSRKQAPQLGSANGRIVLHLRAVLQRFMSCCMI